MDKIEVASGDTLFSIARRCLGSAYRYREIFRINEAAILREHRRRSLEQYLHDRGRTYDPQDWIFPGMILLVPKVA
jgi:nucleoid-associated protein YgaU